MNGSRSSIGDVHVSEACAQLDRTTLIETALMVTNRFPVQGVIPMLFRDEAVDKLRAAAPYVDSSSDIGTYTWADGKRLHINFEHLAMPTPTKDAWAPYPDRCGALSEVVNIITQIREKYAAVKHLLRWFNANATPAAIRAVWPSILSLCPNSPLCKEYADMPARYTAPDDIGTYLPLIRDTAQTVAAMQLIPGDAKPHNRGTVWLTFLDGAFNRELLQLNGNTLSVNL